MSNSKIYLGSTNLGTGKIRLGANDVSAIYLGANKVYGDTTPPIPINDLLCFTANTANSSVSFYNYGTNPVLYYSVNNGSNWNLWDGTAITLSSVGDKVYFYGTNPNGISSSGTDYSKFETTGSLTLSGNVMSLIDYTCPNTIPNTYCFAYLFKDTSITSIANFSLPATTLTERCYAYMFRGCSSLVTVPSGLLPATTLATGCYFNMFTNCTSITSLPSDFLPATTLASSCYYFMFGGCTGLVVAPYLMAQTLVQECYGEMFYGCSSLNSVRCMATSISATDCTVSWLSGVAQTGTFYKSTVPNWQTGASGIPTGWTTQNVYNCSDDYVIMGYGSEGQCTCIEDGDNMGHASLGDCMCNEFNECIDCSTDWETLGYESEEDCDCQVYGNCPEEEEPEPEP